MKVTELSKLLKATTLKQDNIKQFAFAVCGHTTIEIHLDKKDGIVVWQIITALSGGTCNRKDKAIMGIYTEIVDYINSDIQSMILYVHKNVATVRESK